MGQILVRNLDDEVIASLKLKAELKGLSLEQELRNVLTAAASLNRPERVAWIKRVRSKSPPLKDFDVSAAVRYGRDDEHE
jgi:antitoxin FitA